MSLVVNTLTVTPVFISVLMLIGDPMVFVLSLATTVPHTSIFCFTLGNIVVDSNTREVITRLL